MEDLYILLPMYECMIGLAQQTLHLIVLTFAKMLEKVFWSTASNCISPNFAIVCTFESSCPWAVIMLTPVVLVLDRLNTI
jgi:hypothetical protein